ncbi:MAG: hypothetical protein ACLVH2_00045 [Streptococcus sp.]
MPWYAGKDSRISYFAKKMLGFLIQEMSVFVKQRVSMTFVDSDDWVEHTYVEELHDKLKAYDAVILPIIISLMRPIFFLFYITDEDYYEHALLLS